MVRTVKKSIRKGVVFDTRTGSVIEDLNSEHIPFEEHKYYAALTKCGHCGDGYFMPVLFEISAPNKHSAIEEIKNKRRVKHGGDEYILAFTEITFDEYRFLEIVNDTNDFIMTTNLNENSPIIRQKRVIEPARASGFIQDVQASVGEEAGLSIAKRDIRTADKYGSGMILQRATAPSWYGDKLVYPSKINLRELLEPYFAECVKNGLNSRFQATFIRRYYILYGENNSLGLTYNPQKGVIVYSINPKRPPLLTAPAEDFVEATRQKYEETKPKPQEEYSGKQIERKSAVDKFNARMERFRNGQQNNSSSQTGNAPKGSQPGEE